MPYTYKITVHTANVKDAGTDADIYISIYGSKSSLLEQKLHDSNDKDDFEADDVNKISLQSPYDLGDIEKITIWHDNSGEKPGWYLNYVQIETPNGLSIKFRADRWLAEDEDDGKLCITLYPPVNTISANNEAIRYITLKNNTDFVAHIKIHAKHSDGSQNTYEIQKDIIRKADHCIDMSNIKGFIREGDTVNFEAVIVGSTNKINSNTFTYRSSSNKQAIFKIAGSADNFNFTFDQISSKGNKNSKYPEIATFSLENSGSYSACMCIHVEHENGSTDSFESSDINLGEKDFVTLANHKEVQDGDTVWLELVVHLGSSKTAPEKFTYRSSATDEARYSASGTFLDAGHLGPKLSFVGLNSNNSDLPEIGKFTLKNTGTFVAHLRVHFEHEDESTDSYETGDILEGKSDYVTISNHKEARDGDIVWLEAYVAWGDNRKATERFIYKKGATANAKYTISGAVRTTSLKFNELSGNQYYLGYRQTYVKKSTSPSNVRTNYSNDVQGICHDDNYFYVSHGAGGGDGRNHGTIHRVNKYSLGKVAKCTERKLNDCIVFNNGKTEYRRFYKYYNDANEPMGLKVGDIHMGDIDCYRGYLFVPIYQNGDDGSADAQILIFSTKTFDCVWQEILYKQPNQKFDKLAWCAINPKDECLYTSESNISNSFSNGKTPLMAFKINFDNLEKKQGPVFTNVTPNGIKLQMPDGSDFLMEGGLQGGCFDTFDTIYICSGFMKGRKRNDGVFPFKLNRNLDSVMFKYIQDRAYYIWQRKGCPIQSNTDSLKDWQEAQWQIEDSIRFGKLRHCEVPVSATACMYKDDNGDLTSPIDFSFDSANLIFPEEPEGITYWDLRKYSFDENLPEYIYSTLHVQRLTNNAKGIKKDSFSLLNYNINSMDTTDIVINYNPKTLEIRDNPITSFWTIVSDGYIPVANFTSKDVAKTALKILSQFKQLIIVGEADLPQDEYDISQRFTDNGLMLLRNPIGIVNMSSLANFTFDYEEVKVFGHTSNKVQIAESNTSKDEYVSYWYAKLINFTEKRTTVLRAFNEHDAWILRRDAEKYTKCCTFTDSHIQHSFLWFEH